MNGKPLLRLLIFKDATEENIIETIQKTLPAIACTK